MKRLICPLLFSGSIFRRRVVILCLALVIHVFASPQPLVAQVDQELQLLPTIGLQDSGVPPRDPLYVAPQDTDAELVPRAEPTQEESFTFDPPTLADESFMEEGITGSDQLPSSGWFYPRLWRPRHCWEGGVEVGINGSSGNSESLSLTTGVNAKRINGPVTLAWDLTYSKTETGSFETQHNLLLNVDYDYEFEGSPWSWFAKSFYEYDEFKSFDSRLSMNGGGGLDIFDNPRAHLTGRVGAGWSREFGGLTRRYVPEATYGANYECELSHRQRLLFDVQYLPEWESFSRYRFVADAHWTILLDQETDLHLKIGAIDRYDSTPNGAKPNDLTYNLLLLWKL